jgi:hypothetical protein
MTRGATDNDTTAHLEHGEPAGLPAITNCASSFRTIPEGGLRLCGIRLQPKAKSCRRAALLCTRRSAATRRPAACSATPPAPVGAGAHNADAGRGSPTPSTGQVSMPGRRRAYASALVSAGGAKTGTARQTSARLRLAHSTVRSGRTTAALARPACSHSASSVPG